LQISGSSRNVERGSQRFGGDLKIDCAVTVKLRSAAHSISFAGSVKLKIDAPVENFPVSATFTPGASLQTQAC
jgi:hypothetical protein